MSDLQQHMTVVEGKVIMHYIYVFIYNTFYGNLCFYCYFKYYLFVEMIVNLYRKQYMRKVMPDVGNSKSTVTSCGLLSGG